MIYKSNPWISAQGTLRSSDKNYECSVQGREVWLLRVKGYDSPEAVDMLKGLRLLMPACERPALDSTEEFYVQELIGMQVS